MTPTMTRLEGNGVWAELWLGDCLEVLPKLGKVDAVVTDPPYGIGYVHGEGGGCLAKSTVFAGQSVVNDDKPFNPKRWLQFPMVIMWGANHYASRLPNSPAWLVWDKRDGICSNDQADCELAWTSLQSPARLKRHLWNGMLKQTERGESRYHPTQKPIALMQWCLGFLNGSQVILDPFMGSGTTGVACMRTGRNFIGIEICEKYHQIAVERIQRELNQLKLL